MVITNCKKIKLINNNTNNDTNKVVIYIIKLLTKYNKR